MFAPVAGGSVNRPTFRQWIVDLTYAKRRAIRLSILRACSRHPVYLFLNDLGILDHRDAIALGNFAFEGDGFAGVFGELIIHRFVIADDEIGFAFARDAGRSATSDAFGCTGG